MPKRRPTSGAGRPFGATMLVLGLVIASCGNSKDSASPTTAAPVATSAAPATTAASSASTEGATAPTDTEAGAVETTAAATDTFVPISGVPGVTDTAIDYAVVGTKANNPLGTCILDCYLTGIEAYFAFRNSTGGIYGRELKIAATLDDELVQNQVRALEITAGNEYFGDFNATLNASGWGDLDAAGVPTYTWGINATEASGRPAIFPSVGIACADCTSRAVPYVASVAKATKIATIGYGVSENSKLCSQSQAKSVERYSAQTGQTVAYQNDNLDFGLPNGIGPQVTAMKEAGVEFIATCIDLNGMKTLAQELDRQGMQSVILYHPNTYNQSFVKEAGALFEGDFVGVSFRPFEAGAGKSRLNDYLTWMDKQGSDLTELAMVGWINADLAYEGLKAAGPEFDRAKVVAATNALTEYSAGGLIVPIDWTRQHNPPTQDDPTTNGYRQECIAVVRIVGGAFETVAPKDKPFLCWSNANRDWSEPVPTDLG